MDYDLYLSNYSFKIWESVPWCKLTHRTPLTLYSFLELQHLIYSQFMLYIALIVFLARLRAEFSTVFLKVTSLAVNSSLFFFFFKSWSTSITNKKPSNKKYSTQTCLGLWKSNYMYCKTISSIRQKVSAKSMVRTCSPSDDSKSAAARQGMKKQSNCIFK